MSGTGLVATADLVDQDDGTIVLTARDLSTFEVVGRLDDVTSHGGTEVAIPIQFVPGSTQLAIGLRGGTEIASLVSMWWASESTGVFRWKSLPRLCR